MSKHDDDVAAAEQQVTDAYEVCQRLRSDVLHVAADWYRIWVPDFAKERVRERHDVALKLGKDRVQAMRAQVEQLASSADALIEGEVGGQDPQRWPHYDNRPDAGTALVGSDTATRLGRALRGAMGTLGRVLIDHGLESPGMGMTSVWSEQGPRGDVRVVAGSVVSIGGEVTDAIRAYGVALLAWARSKQHLQKALDARARGAADDLWGD